ncbi:thioredoxin [Microlunatus sp. Gsoil 973]|uniref:thioredoxin n=1 Tax=Microlunatus sp. Gsoil 973 TaxID=2672569 RepID=UPI0012B45632|nr:thioredoxin [Microlunatus sp. Gsoil 973]QGN32687.1 thioredoxin [Microlunatus sp. Gsoil 973]
MQALTNDTFDDFLRTADRPVLVDFWAEWCPPCRLVEPILDQLADELTGELLITKINSDENPQISARYRVLGLPTMILFVHGEPVKSIMGARSKRALRAELEPHLGSEVATSSGNAAG